MSAEQHDPKDELGFDPDSPDLEDPQVDPIGPAKAPEDGPKVDGERPVKDSDYPPYKDE